LDDRTVTEVPDVPDAPVASEPPLALVLALWVPVVAVVAWFLVRLSSGRWITDPAPRLGLPDHDGDDREDPGA
jgi:hypothetical protein